MGLDAFFYRRTKRKEISDFDVFKWMSDFDSELNGLLVDLNYVANKKNISLNAALKEAITNYITESNDNEILYFRKFHFLNHFLNYDFSWYDKDMEISKDKCIELRDLAKKCLDACETYKKKNPSDASEYFYDKICEDNLPDGSAFNDWSLYTKIQDLYNGMNDIIESTDWNNQIIVYNANW